VSIIHLISGCKKGDRNSQQDLYMHFADHVMSIAYRYARDLPEAEDILQNAFIKVFENINSYDAKKGSFEPWLSRIVINEALQLLKKNSRYLLTNRNDGEVFEQTVESNILELMEAEQIHALMHQLPDGYRIVFNLYVIEEYTHKEIATLLEITESASRSQLTRAKKMLRKLIDQQKNFRHAI
jgi:RNA polymerase sigma-70 factor (ECF subfamily)